MLCSGCINLIASVGLVTSMAAGRVLGSMPSGTLVLGGKTTIFSVATSESSAEATTCSFQAILSMLSWDCLLSGDEIQHINDDNC